MFNIKDVHIEISSKCTLKCPRCPRTELKPKQLNREIALLEFMTAFPADMLANMQSFLFCGDIGDPIYATEFLEIVAYLKLNKIQVKIVTNGSYKSTDWWDRLGHMLDIHDIVTFSIDGWNQASNEQYRVNSDFDSIVRGARALREVTQAQMIVSSIYFKFNQDHMKKIESLAQEIGFDVFQTVHSSKFDNQYLVDCVDSLKPKEEFVAKSVYKLNKIKLTPRIINTVDTVEMNTKKHAWAKCVNGDKAMFINVEGLVFPCPWFNSGYLENDFVTKYKDKINIKTRTLKEIVEDPLWDEMYTRFETMPLEICKMKCRDA